MHFLKAIFRNQCLRQWLREYLKYLAPKFLYFTMLYEFTKNEHFLYLSLGVTEILSVGLSDQNNSFLKTDFSYLLWLQSYCC